MKHKNMEVGEVLPRLSLMVDEERKEFYKTHLHFVTLLTENLLTIQVWPRLLKIGLCWVRMPILMFQLKYLLVVVNEAWLTMATFLTVKILD